MKQVALKYQCACAVNLTCFVNSTLPNHKMGPVIGFKMGPCRKSRLFEGPSIFWAPKWHSAWTHLETYNRPHLVIWSGRFYKTTPGLQHRSLNSYNRGCSLYGAGLYEFYAGPNVKAPHKTHKAQRHIINSLIGNFIQMRTEWMFQGPNTSRP